MHANRNNLLYLNTLLLAIIIGCGVFFYLHASSKAKAVAAELKKLGEAYIEYTVVIRDTIPLFSDINIMDDVPVYLDMQLKSMLPVKFTQQVNDSFLLPVQLQLRDVLHVDTSLALTDNMQLYAEGNIPIDQKITMRGLGNLKIRTRAQIPLNQILSVKLLNTPSYSTHIPVKMDISQQIPIKLNLQLPISQNLAVNMPIHSMAKVSFPNKVRILGYIPIELEVPVRIPLRNTAMKQHLDKAAEHLVDMF